MLKIAPEYAAGAAEEGLEIKIENLNEQAAGLFGTYQHVLRSLPSSQPLTQRMSNEDQVRMHKKMCELARSEGEKPDIISNLRVRSYLSLL